MKKLNEGDGSTAENDQPKRNVWPFAAGFVIGLLLPFVFLDEPQSKGLFSLLVACLSGGMVMGCTMSVISNLAKRA